MTAMKMVKIRKLLDYNDDKGNCIAHDNDDDNHNFIYIYIFLIGLIKILTMI